MSRIRQLKPEFFLDEDLAATCCRDARLLFMGLWVLADRLGIVEDRPAMIKALIFPYDDDITAKTVSELLQMLGRGKFIVQYQSEGKKLIWIRNFEKHQHIHPNETRSLYQIPSKDDTDLSGNYKNAQEIPHTFTSTYTVTSTSTSGGSASHSGAAKRRRSRSQTGAPDEFEISDSLAAWALQNCPTIDLKEETDVFLDYHRARGTSFSSWDAAWRTWMKKAVKFAKESSRSGNGHGTSRATKPDTTGANDHKPDPEYAGVIEQAKRKAREADPFAELETKGEK